LPFPLAREHVARSMYAMPSASAAHTRAAEGPGPGPLFFFAFFPVASSLRRPGRRGVVAAT
jgi:hypothetical protein